MPLTKISTNSVKDDAVTVDKMASNSVGSSQIINTGVSTDDIANQAVNADKIANNTITTLKIGNNQVTTEKIADNAITQAKLNVPLNNPNIIVNGDMRVYQRGSQSGEGFSVDRMRTEISTLNENPTTTQGTVASGTTPYSLGFRNTWKIQNGHQTNSTPAVDARILLQYKIEAQDIANSGWNYTSSSSYLTLSFWVKSSVAQNFYGIFQSYDGTAQNYPFETGSLTADTWTKITKTIPGNSNLTFDNNNDTGVKIELNMLRGTTYTDNGVTLNQWAAYASETRTPDQTTTWYTTNDATFEITGFKLEVGNIATDFILEPFETTKRKCLRYYQKSYNYGVAPGTASNSGMITGSVSDARTNRLDLGTRFETEMRSTPTMTIYRPFSGITGSVDNFGSGNGTSALNGKTVTMRGLGRKGFAGFTLGSSTGGSLGYHYQADAEL